MEDHRMGILIIYWINIYLSLVISLGGIDEQLWDISKYFHQQRDHLNYWFVLICYFPWNIKSHFNKFNNYNTKVWNNTFHSF